MRSRILRTLLLPLLAASAPAEHSKPSGTMIMVDDFGDQNHGPNWHPSIRTPAPDRFAGVCRLQPALLGGINVMDGSVTCNEVAAAHDLQLRPVSFSS